MQFSLKRLLLIMSALCVSFAVVGWSVPVGTGLVLLTIGVSLGHFGTWGARDLRMIFLLAAGFMVFSAGRYTRQFHWDHSETAAGLPFAWLRVLRWVPRADPSLINIKWQCLVEWSKLFPATMLAILVAELLCLIWQRRAKGITSQKEGHLRVQWLTSAVAGSAVGLIVPTEPEWIGVVLALLALPAAVVVVMWPCCSYAGVALACAFAVGSMWWCQAFHDHFNNPHMITRSGVRELSQGVVFWMLYLVPNETAVFIRRWITKHRAI